MFAGLVLSCYYWVVLIVLALRRGNGGAVGVLGVNAAALVTALFTSDTQVIFGVFSWGLLALFAALIAPDVARTVRPWFPAPRSDNEGGATPGGRAQRGAQGGRKSEKRGKRSSAVASEVVTTGHASARDREHWLRQHPGARRSSSGAWGPGTGRC